MGLCASSNISEPVEKSNPLNNTQKSTKQPSRKLEKQVSAQLALAKKRRQVIQDAAAQIPEDPEELAKFRKAYKPPTFDKSGETKKMLKKVVYYLHD